MQLASYGPFVLRVVVGFVMALHGKAKLDNLEGTAGFFGSLGIPMPELMAPLVMAIELGGGILLMLGLGTRIVAWPMAAVVATAIVKARWSLDLLSPGPELEWTLLSALIALALMGPGALSLDRRLGLDKGAR